MFQAGLFLASRQFELAGATQYYHSAYKTDSSHGDVDRGRHGVLMGCQHVSAAYYRDDDDAGDNGGEEPAGKHARQEHGRTRAG